MKEGVAMIANMPLRLIPIRLDIRLAENVLIGESISVIII